MARDWACRALVDDYRDDDPGQTVRIARIQRFDGIPASPLIGEIGPAVLEYLGEVFYIARVTNDLYDVARKLASRHAAQVTRALAASIQAGEVPDWRWILPTRCSHGLTFTTTNRRTGWLRSSRNSRTMGPMPRAARSDRACTFGPFRSAHRPHAGSTGEAGARSLRGTVRSPGAAGADL
jgi:hypothetical protein